MIFLQCYLESQNYKGAIGLKIKKITKALNYCFNSKFRKNNRFTGTNLVLKLYIS